MPEQGNRYKVYERGLLHSYEGTMTREKPYMETDSLEEAKVAARDFIDFDLQGFIYDTATGETTDAWDIVDEPEAAQAKQAVPDASAPVTEEVAEFCAIVAQGGAQLITHEAMIDLLNATDRWTNKAVFGIYACVEPTGRYSICDNSSGDCFTETFETIAGAQAYLRGADATTAYEIDRKAARGEQLPDTATPARPAFKDRLVVLDTRPGWDGKVDALLYDPGAPKDLTPFIIAQSFDAETMSWSSGTYIHDLAQAVSRFREQPDPEWAVTGLTPQQVIDAWGGEYTITQEEAEAIAHAANDTASEYVSAETEDVRRLVEDSCPRKGMATTAEKAGDDRPGVSLKGEARAMRNAAAELAGVDSHETRVDKDR